MDCSDLLQSFRHVIQGKDQFRWLKEHRMLGSSSQLIIKADKSTQGSYKCLARAAIAGEQVLVMMRKTVHITVESEPPVLCFYMKYISFTLYRAILQYKGSGL